MAAPVRLFFLQHPVEEGFRFLHGGEAGQEDVIAHVVGQGLVEHAVFLDGGAVLLPDLLPAHDVAPAVPAEKAPGTAGEFKLYNTDPRDAAMVMAIVADSLGKPINELRFISIREVKEDEV